MNEQLSQVYRIATQFENLYGKNNKTTKLDLTSPDVISLHKKLKQLKKNKIDNVILEASSHGLSQGRLNGIEFKAGILQILAKII